MRAFCCPGSGGPPASVTPASRVPRCSTLLYLLDVNLICYSNEMPSLVAVLVFFFLYLLFFQVTYVNNPSSLHLVNVLDVFHAAYTYYVAIVYVCVRV